MDKRVLNIETRKRAIELQESFVDIVDLLQPAANFPVTAWLIDVLVSLRLFGDALE